MSDSNSLYDSFYSSNLENYIVKPINKSVADLEKEIESLESEIERIERIKYLSGLKKTAPLKLARDKEKLDKIREQIKKAATFDLTMSAARKRPKPPGMTSRDTLPPPRVINEVVVVDKVEQFTDKTHKTFVRMIDNNYYSEQIVTKIVGMENVDWWEYVLVYGIFKALKISYEYTKLKDAIKNGIKSTRTVSGKLVEINFVPNVRFEPIQSFETLNEETVIREKGTKYLSSSITVEVPQNMVSKTNEYKRGFFLYEDTYDTLEVDYNKLIIDFDEIVAKYNIHESLRNEIKKNLISYGRLSGI